MNDFEAFRDDLQDTLVHLHDPDYRPPPRVCLVLNCRPEDGTSTLQAALNRFVTNQIDSSELSDSRIKRYLEILQQRYLIKLTQNAIAEHMGIGVRSVQRLQREAVHMLAVDLWKAHNPRAAEELQAPTDEWVSQVRQELAVLTQSNPHAEADVHTAIQGALRIAQATATNPEITFETALTPTNQVKLHPAVLRQVLIDVITELQRTMPTGQIRLNTRQNKDQATITIAANPLPATASINTTLAHELLTAQDAAITTTNDGEQLVITIQVPLAEPTVQTVTVLVVDDNPDLAALYESYCVETIYKIVHVREGKRVRQAIAESAPSIILLDMMLPDVDGWDLLLDLHANPETRDIPVIVCSVVTDAKLAHDLGAAQYLRKPVWRKQLLAAFDDALNPPAASDPKDRASNPGTC